MAADGSIREHIEGAADHSEHNQLLDFAEDVERLARGQSRRTEGIGITRFEAPLERVSVPLREAGPDDITISLVSAGPGKWDLAERSGMPGIPVPRLLGWQGAGVVAEVGANVSDLKPGDEVVAYMPMYGFYAREVTVPARSVAKAPRTIPLQDAGALLVSAATAVEALVDVARLSAGQTVLVTAAAGATGMHAVRLAKHLGAHVIGTGSKGSFNFIESLGADEVYDYAADLVGEIRRRHPDGVDVLLDNVSPDSVTRHAVLVRSGGHAIGTHAPHPTAPAGTHGRLILSWNYADRFRDVVDFVDQGVLKVEIVRRYRWAEANEAHDWLSSSGGKGNILLVPD